jgi:uncharacterized protein (TIGR02001 family)
VLAGLALDPPSAWAATAGSIAVATQDIYRGDQASEGDPVVTIGLHHEDISGFYLGGNVTTSVDQGTLRLASGSQYAGYSFAAGGNTIELGVIHRTFRKDYSDEYTPDFTEAYAGISRGGLTARVFLSPRYVPGRFSVYTEVDAEIYAHRGWSLSGHAGLRLTNTGGPPITTETTKFDGSLRLEKTIGRLSLGATLTDVATKDGVETPRVAFAAHFAF